MTTLSAANRGKSLLERIWSRVTKTETCWLWEGALTRTGFGTIRVARSRCVRVHRATFEAKHGLIPDGHEVIHATCKVRRCCRPDHLEAVTHAESLRRKSDFADIPGEDWRPIPGFAGRYDVSNLGRVRSWCPSRRRLPIPRLLSPAQKSERAPYQCVGLFVDGRVRGVQVHTLVLEAFVGPRPAGLQAGHWDGDHRNNRLSNLSWITPKENGQDKVRHGRSQRGERSASAKLTESQVRELRRRAALGEQFRRLAKEFGVSASAAAQIARGLRWGHVAGPLCGSRRPQSSSISSTKTIAWRTDL